MSDALVDAVHQARVDLNALRLDANLTYRELATDVGIPEPTLHRFLNDPDAEVFARTFHRIRKFLDARRAVR